ncbi:hypothetical protein ACVS9Y_004206, partial [Cronobacter sakazakii]
LKRWARFTGVANSGEVILSFECHAKSLICVLCLSDDSAFPVKHVAGRVQAIELSPPNEKAPCIGQYINENRSRSFLPLRLTPLSTFISFYVKRM